MPVLQIVKTIIRGIFSHGRPHSLAPRPRASTRRFPTSIYLLRVIRRFLATSKDTKYMPEDAFFLVVGSGLVSLRGLGASGGIRLALSGGRSRGSISGRGRSIRRATKQMGEPGSRRGRIRAPAIAVLGRLAPGDEILLRRFRASSIGKQSRLLINRFLDDSRRRFEILRVAVRGLTRPRAS